MMPYDRCRLMETDHLLRRLMTTSFRSFRPWPLGWAVACILAVGVTLSARSTRAGPPEAAEDRETGIGLPPMPTLGGMQFWADELFFHRWRIQRNVLTGHYRLLDGNLLRHASGTYGECLAKLQEIKRERNLPPMQGRAVVTLHGLAHSRVSMTPLGKYIESRSDYTVFNVGYPSTRCGIEEHAQALAKIVEHLDGIREINFVAHSMGNILVRRFLADQTDESAGRRPDGRIKRIVMLGPPNHGSILADKLGENGAFKFVLGDSGQQLGREWVWTENSLVTPRCEFGIIAGGLGNRHGINPLLPGDNDGVVTVASARLAGARDMVLVPTLHSAMIIDPRVHEYVLRFLTHGHFVSESMRRPVVGE
jgi:pimeloyl-ACP methyl ester carboxylesterase